MENLESKLAANGETLQTSNDLRLPTRHGLTTGRINGKAFADLGSDFTMGNSGAPLRARKPTTYSSRKKQEQRSTRVVLDSDSSSSDELDSLSHSDNHSPEKKKVKRVDEEIQGDLAGSVHALRAQKQSKALQNIRFKKTKSEGKMQPEASTSKAPPSKENEPRVGTVQETDTHSKRSRTSKPTKSPQGSWSDNWETSRPLGDKSPNRQLSPPPSPEPPREKPKPRPIKKPQATSGDATPKTTKKPNIPTVKKPQFPPPVKRAPSPSEVDESCVVHSDSGNPSSRRQPEQFPCLSPTSQLTPRANPPSKMAEGFPLSPLKSRVDEFPFPSPLASDDKAKKIAPSAFPMPSPQSLDKGKGKALTADAECSEEDEEGSYGRKGKSTRLEPFPMNTQMLRSTSSPSVRSSQAKKRNSDGIRSDGDQHAKKRRKDDDDDMLSSPAEDYAFEDDDDTLFMSPSVDPKTLCPYCDTPLPTSPTPLLTRLLAKVSKKSSRDPRPANPLGRKAPLATFIAVCQRHRFESQILPEAEQKGWPKTIDWAKVGGRVEGMRDSLQALINDRDDNDGEEFFWETGGPRSKCVFWRDVMSEVKQKGSRAVAGVRGQFANFEKTQPGYYGELGSVIIHQTLYNLFPPSELDPDATSPLTSNEFVQRILVPEVAVRLIKEDQNLNGDSGTNQALQILRESSAYGVAMFPEDSGEGGGVGPSRSSREQMQEDGMGAGDLIVMERARKRRKELEEEDERGEEQDRKKLETRGRRKQKGKAKETTQEEDSGSDVVFVSQKPKPRPRPISKSSSIGNADIDEEEMEVSIPKRTASSATMTDEGNVKPQRPKRRTAEKFPFDVDVDSAGSTDTDSLQPKPSYRHRSLSASETGNQSVRVSPTSSPRPPLPKKLRKKKGTSEVNLNSTSESESDRSAASRTEGDRHPRRMKKVESFMDIAVDSLEIKDDHSIYDDRHARTPLAKRHRQRTIEVTDDDTPKPARSPSRASSAVPTTSESLKPLDLARLRRQGKQAKDLAREPPRKASLEPPWVRSMYDPPRGSDDGSTSSRPPTPLRRRGFGWLLSDSSQSSLGSR